MVARIDWLSNGIDRMLAGRSPLSPHEWEVRDSVLAKDVDLLRTAAQLNSLRPGAARPNTAFVAALGARIAAEAALAQPTSAGSDDDLAG